MRKTFYPFLLILLGSCAPDNPDPSIDTSIQAYVPVYATPVLNGTVSAESPRPTEKAGKIYAYASYIFQNEINEGIHVIDRSDINQPRKIAFLKIPFNTELAVRGNYIYANNASDLLVINVADPLNPSVVRRIKDAFPLLNQEYPPLPGMFVCADPSKGIVIDWELKTVEKANCRR